MTQETGEDQGGPDPTPRRLQRSSTNKMIGGVAGGMAEYFGVDSRLVRIGWVIAGVMGWGLLAYLLCWIFIPKEAVPA